MSSQPTRAPRKWTPAENNLLQETVEEYKMSGKPICWPEIATAFQDRSKDDCRKRWAKMDDKWKKGAWDSSEDNMLSQSVRENGCRWTDISKAIGTRSPDQCAKRWRNSLNPNNSRSEWTEEDEKTLAEAVRSHGNDWKLIQERYLSDRSRLDLSNRYVSLCRQEKKKQHSQSSASPTQTRTQDRHPSWEPEPRSGLIPTSPENDLQQHDIQDLLETSIDYETINSWILHGTQADNMDFSDPQLFAGVHGQFEPQNSQEHDDVFTTMNPYIERDNARSVLTSAYISTPRYPFSNATLSSATMSAESWMNPSPTISEGIPATTNRQQRPDGVDNQATLKDIITETTTPSPSNEIVPMNTPLEKGTTVLTLENMDPETRSECLDWLCRRKIVTKIEIV